MTGTALLIISVISYCLATVLVFMFIRSVSKQQPPVILLNVASGAAFFALICHVIYAYSNSQLDGMLNVSLSSMLILVSAILSFIYLLGTLFMTIRRLGVLVYPLIIFCLAVSYFWQSSDSARHVNTELSIHILVSLAAYSLLTIATIQALLYVYQERQIKRRTQPAMLMALPPLQTMEALLFRMLGVGFILLTLTLLSGALFSQQLFGYAFEFKHHTILAILGWAVFGSLLYKRVNHGLRGSQAVIWTVAGFVLIQLGYFGTKLVDEILL